MREINKYLLEDIINEIKDNGNITEKEISNKYYYSERTIRRYFKILKDKGFIELVKSGNRNKWIIRK